MPYKDKQKQSQYQLKRQQRLRTDWLLVNGPCKKCDSNNNLEIDHIDPTKKITHRIWSWSYDRRTLELAKCQVLCKKCHKEKSKIEWFCRGENHPNHKLSQDDINKIRSEYKLGIRGYGYKALAKKYNVDHTTIRSIIIGTTWKQ